MHIDKHAQTIRNTLMSLKDPYELYNDGPAIGSKEEAEGVEDTFFNLGEVMEEIQQLLEAGYTLDMNPLLHLREYFPNFYWKSYPSSTDRYKDIIRGADYIWKAAGKYVTAIERDTPGPNGADYIWRKPGEPVRMRDATTGRRRICYCQKRFEDMPLEAWPVDPNWVTETEALILVPTDNEITMIGSVNGEVRELKRGQLERGGPTFYEAEDILAKRGILTFRRTAFAES